jgi:hypothetical protein
MSLWHRCRFCSNAYQDFTGHWRGGMNDEGRSGGVSISGLVALTEQALLLDLRLVGNIPRYLT